MSASPRVYRVGDPATPADAVDVGRGGRGHRRSAYGNPFRLLKDTPAERERVVAAFRAHATIHLRHYPDWLKPLVGRSLLCHCAPSGGLTAEDRPLMCHGQVLLALARADYIPDAPAVPMQPSLLEV